MNTSSGSTSDEANGEQCTNIISIEEFNALVEQTRQLQVRLDELELQQNEDVPISIAPLKQSHLGYRESRNRRRSSALNESMVEELYDTFELPPDTYTLLMTQPIYSIPFLAGFIAPLLAASCLILAFINELDQKSHGNPFGVPAGVRNPVRAAQFLGVIVGILMESEIPTGLTIIGKGAEQQGGEVALRWSRLVATSLLRMTIGYLFICCLFLTVSSHRVRTSYWSDAFELINVMIYSFGNQMRISIVFLIRQ